MTDLETRLRAIIDASLFTPVGENEITPESSFREDMGADSIDIASIAMAVEDEAFLRAERDGAWKIRHEVHRLIAVRGASVGHVPV